MNKESLEAIRDKVIELLHNSDIDECDKVELMLNLNRFLSPDNYEQEIQTLRKRQK